MRRGLTIAGIVVLIIGVLLIGVGYAVNAMGTTTDVSAGRVLTLTPQTIGSASVQISWSGAPSGATVYLVSGTPTCSSPSGVIAQGSGATGSFGTTLSSGTTYSLYACNGGSGAAATFVYSSTGLTYLIVIGIVVAVIGAILLVLGARAKKTSASVPPAAPEVYPPAQP